MDAAEHDNIGVVDVAGLARQLERITDEIGNLEDLGPLIIMRQYHGSALDLEAADFVDLADKTFACLKIVAGLIERAQALEKVARIGADYRCIATAGFQVFHRSYAHALCRRARPIVSIGDRRHRSVSLWRSTLRQSDTYVIKILTPRTSAVTAALNGN